MININWHYKPDDLFSEEHDFFGEAELLTSDHVQDTPVYSIIEKIRLITFEEYYA
ncbi:MAG: hypothetical protein V2I33_20400 [Kangiellaceae bacterium]|jgi:hypothetical protein|nr:hypothetical protein [Kangiellaceae bacterium]